MRVRIGFMKLWVEGELWVWDEGRKGLRISKEEEVRKREKEGGEEGGVRTENVFC